MPLDGTGVFGEPEKLLQRLIRFDTTNPPGNEAGCVAFIEGLLSDAGLTTSRVARAPSRPNLIARLPGRGEAPPLLMYGHVDVVPTTGQPWTHPPFEGRIANGCVWGRGALDMKGGVAMMLAALLRAATDGVIPRGDVLLAIVSDEENSGAFGAQHLVEHHANLFDGVRHAIGEFGGFAQTVAGRRFYPIQVAEKQYCALRLTLRGPGGHGSLPARGGSMAKLGRALRRLDTRALPVHVTPVARRMFESMAISLPLPHRLLFNLLLVPALTERLLPLLGSQRAAIEALLRNTVNPTIVRGGDALNVIPGEVTLELDGRVLPGLAADDLVNELRAVVGDAGTIEVTRFDPGSVGPDMALFDMLSDVLRRADPAAIPVPLLVPGVTDARHFAHLGIQTYGFLPMNLPADFAFSSLIHAADERIPVEAVRFGAQALYDLISSYGAA